MAGGGILNIEHRKPKLCRAGEIVSKPHFIVAADVSRLIILGISFEIRADARPLLQF